jgi:predicted DCC family thiol-disulfide oxidoreductase YuxK
MPLNEPVLLFNDECGVCRHIANWVRRSDRGSWGKPRLIIRPIGEDPQALKVLDPNLNIWDAYATIHLLMPDGTMKLGGEAVAEVLRNLPNTRWFAWAFAINLFGFKPFQILLNFAYILLADTRPLFGCESCGKPKVWVKPIAAAVQWISSLFGKPSNPAVRSTSIPTVTTKP